MLANTVLLILKLFFELHTYLIEVVFDYWMSYLIVSDRIPVANQTPNLMGPALNAPGNHS
jgi:hypothetical protein